MYTKKREGNKKYYDNFFVNVSIIKTLFVHTQSQNTQIKGKERKIEKGLEKKTERYIISEQKK